MKIQIIVALLYAGAIVAENVQKQEIIILYGTSSAGKTSISTVLGNMLPGKWKVLGIDMFPKAASGGGPSMANSLMWKKVNEEIANGYNVVVDTVVSNFLFDKSKADSFVVVTYCSPAVLVEHVTKRNASGKDREHRTLKKVLKQFYNKYNTQEHKKDSIDVLYKSDLENIKGSWALRNLKKEFFGSDRSVVYVASRLYSYDYFINTGTMSIVNCAKKIKDEFIKFQGKE